MVISKYKPLFVICQPLFFILSRFAKFCIAIFPIEIYNAFMQEKVLVICPTRGRPQMCAKMIDSFLERSHMSTLTLALDMDDPCIEEYQNIIAGRVNYTIDFRQPTTNLINSKFKFSADCFKWFSVTNDDFIYHTDGWDEKLVNLIRLHGGTGIAYGNDLLANRSLPTTSVISRDIVEALGWLQLPTLTHLFGDTVWNHLGKKADCLYYHKGVIIEHCHVFANKMEADQTHKYTNSIDMYNKDEESFTKWLLTQSQLDVEKVKSLIKKVTT